MIHILDTDVFTLCELTDSPEYLRLHSRVLALGPEDTIATTIITYEEYEEQTRGWLAYAAKSRDIAHQLKAYDTIETTSAGLLGI